MAPTWRLLTGALRGADGVAPREMLDRLAGLGEGPSYVIGAVIRMISIGPSPTAENRSGLPAGI
jgi:hypothetical protein